MNKNQRQIQEQGREGNSTQQKQHVKSPRGKITKQSLAYVKYTLSQCIYIQTVLPQPHNTLHLDAVHTPVCMCIFVRYPFLPDLSLHKFSLPKPRFLIGSYILVLGYSCSLSFRRIQKHLYLHPSQDCPWTWYHCVVFADAAPSPDSCSGQ